MNKLPTKLLEYLVSQCTKEVLDQISEEKKLKVKFSKEKDTKFKPTVKHLKKPQNEIWGDVAAGAASVLALPAIAAGKETWDNWKNRKCKTCGNPKSKCTCNPKDKVKESDEPSSKPTPQVSSPSLPSGQPPTSDEPEAPESPDASEPEPEEIPQPTTGPVLINPKDKSKLQPIKFPGRDDSTIERTLYDMAVRIAGSKVKVSLGAKRLAREAASNPNAKIFFYLGKMDPESEEIFVMADKSLQIAKNESIQPSEIQGIPSFDKTPSYHDIDGMRDSDLFAYRADKIRGKPRYDTGGLTEETHQMIKKAINKILDRK